MCEQAEYHLFQREKVEVQLPELYHKIGKVFPPTWWRPDDETVVCSLSFINQTFSFSFFFLPANCPSSCWTTVGCRGDRSRGHDVVTAGLWHHHGKIWKWHSWILPRLHEGRGKRTARCRRDDFIVYIKRLRSWLLLMFRSTHLARLHRIWLLPQPDFTLLTLNRYKTLLFQRFLTSSDLNLLFAHVNISFRRFSAARREKHVWTSRLISSVLQSYQWLKEKIVSEDGRKQQAKLKELNHLTEKLGCTLPQLAVGKSSTGRPTCLRHIMTHLPHNREERCRETDTGSAANSSLSPPWVHPHFL